MNDHALDTEVRIFTEEEIFLFAGFLAAMLHVDIEPEDLVPIVDYSVTQTLQFADQRRKEREEADPEV